MDLDFIYDNILKEEIVENEKMTAKTGITDLITGDEIYLKLLNGIKNDNLTCLKLNITDNTAQNGLGTYVHLIINKSQNEIVKIIVPLFSTTRTVTWSSKYNDLILESINNTEYFVNSDELVNKLITLIYFYDTSLNDVAFLQACNVTDFIKTGINGKNSFGNNINCYKWIDKLPDNTALSLKQIKSEFFKYFIINSSIAELENLATKTAESSYNNYYNPENRSNETVISNIKSGLLTEYIHTSMLIEKYGENFVTINNDTDGDDKGVDIILELNSKKINIDVKSTKSTNLSIRSRRNDTDFYAIYLTNSKYKTPKFFGYISKEHFWGNGNDIATPSEYRGSFIKPLEDLKPYLITDESLLIKEQAKQKLNEMKSKINF